MVWQNPDGDVELTPSSGSFVGSNTLSGNAELDYWEIQIAVGPTFEGDNFRVYGGPFLHLIDGDIDIDATGVDDVPSTWRVKSSGDISESSQFGGYAGAQWLAAENTTANIEVQFTSDAWAVGIGAIWKFE